MEIVLLIIGIIIGTVVGYLAADRKSAALRAEISGTKKEIELLKLQKEEAEALHKRMNTEFENLSNRIFQSKAEDFTRLNTEHLGNLLRPLGDNLKDFRQKVEQVYSTEAKERFSLGERIKELMELNNRLSEDANNLTRALKGDSKMQGNWGEMILERLLDGHEDHIGSIPYAMRDVSCPIHGTSMTCGLIKLKLEEHRLADKVKLVTHKPGDVVKAGCFTVEFIHVNHSIPDAVAFAIRTPVGTVVFTGDFKIDPTSHDGMMDLARLGELGNQGVLAMLADSTNVERQGYTPSENVVADSLDRQFRNCDQRIIVTTFASNMHRIQSILSTAQRYGRKVAVSGRSMENMLKVAQELGYLKVKPGTIVDLASIKSLPKNKIVIVSTGSQGENMSALYRMAFSTHKQVEITAGDRIIISASAIPGNEKSISNIINELYRKGADVVYEKSEGLHVSGHACQEELKIVHGLVKPKFFIPVHGEQRHLQLHAKLAQSMGMNPRNIHIGEIGTVFEFTGKTCKVNGTVPAGRVFVDGSGVGDVGSVVLRDRKHLAEDGMIVVCVNLSSEDGSIITGPDIITRGFIYVKESEDLMDELKEVAMEAIDRCQRKRVRDWSAIKSAIKNDLSGYLYKTTKRNPMILPVIMEI